MFVTDLLSAVVASVAIGALIRVAQFASSKEVEKATVRQHAEAIGTYSAMTSATLAAIAIVYWIVTTLFYVAPNVPSLAPLPVARAATAIPKIPAPRNLVPVDELRTMMMANVTPRAPPAMTPVLKHSFR